MSEIKVNSIKGVAATTAALTINNTDGTCTANLTNRINKNLVINGAFQVAQRGTSSTTSGIATVDRFGMYHSGIDEAPTQAQGSVTSGGAYDSGFRKCLKVTNGNQTSGGGAAKYIWIQSLYEAQDNANSGWNYTSTSSFITVQFWVKSSVAQNFYGYLRSVDGSNYLYPFETGSLSANTWTKVTKTIPGNSNLTFDNDTGHGFQINVFPYLGTGYTGSISLNAWSAYNSSVRTPDYTSTWYTTNDATFELTGVQIEVGNVATDFEHRSFAQELKLCERYFEKSYNHSVVPGTATDEGLVMWLANRNPGLPHTSLRYKTTKRGNPTVTIFNTNTADSNTLRDKDTATDLTPQVTRLGESGCTIHTNTSVALGNFMAFHYTANSEI